MKQVYHIAIVLLFLSSLFSACEKQFVQPSAESEVEVTVDKKLISNVCGSTTVDFMAGQNTVAGSITVSNDNEYVYVTFATKGGWVMGKTHLYAGALSGVPVNNSGAPKIGLFPKTATHNPYVTEYTYKYLKRNLPECFVVAAHAEVRKIVNGVVVQSETAWGKGTNFVSKGTWAMYFNYCVQKCCVIEPKVFNYFGGQTIPTGSLVVTNDKENLYITYTTTGNWYLNATHLYVGTLEGLPVNKAKTPIPGQFPYTQTYSPRVQNFSYTIPLSKVPACMIIAAHAELVQVVNGTVVSTETGWSFGTQFPGTSRWGWYSSYCVQTCK
jgi:hypothetical protein